MRDGGGHGLPLGHVNALRIAGSRFTARRMLLDYTENYYVPTMRGDPFTDDPPRG